MTAVNSAADSESSLELFRRNLLAIVTTVLAMGSFLANDTITKFVSPSLPLTQIIVIRGLFASALLLAAVLATGGAPGLRRMFDAVVLWRGVTEVAATYFFLTALFNMPIANVTTLFQVVPLIMTILAVVFLGERVGIRRWTAIGVGFLGVLLVMRPDTGAFSHFSVFVLLAAVVVAVRDLLTRRIDGNISTLVVSLATSLQVLVVAAAFSPFEDWAPVGAAEIAWLGAASVCLIGGYVFVVFSLRVGEMSVVAPFRYTVILFSLLAGYLVWGDVPSLSAVAGIALIAGSGIFVFFRERSKGTQIAARAPQEPGGGV